MWSRSFGNAAEHTQTPALYASGNVVLAWPMQGAVDFRGGDLDGASNEGISLVKLARQMPMKRRKERASFRGVTTSVLDALRAARVQSDEAKGKEP